MKQKLFCPHCGRCLGECDISDSSGKCKIYPSHPQVKNKKHFIHDMKCVKCKEKVYILMEFED